MLRSDLFELLRNGGSSGVEFKRDDVPPDSLAREVVALANLEGGVILLGVEADGTVSGLTRDAKAAEEWVMAVGRDGVRPPIIPYWETLPWDESRRVGAISIPANSADKPYEAKRGSAWVIFVRVGSSSREEEARLYQASGLLRYDLKPVPGSTFPDLDALRLESYFRDIRRQDCPAVDDASAWQHLLLNTGLMVEDRGRAIPTAGGLLLFGRNPHRFLTQAGITATAYAGVEKDYATRERALLRGPVVPRYSPSGDLLERGLVVEAVDFVRRNTAVEAWIDEGGRRNDRWKDYPLEAVREAVVNAIAHRDYTIAVSDIELSLYDDRLEVISPGRLPNTVTVEKMKLGYRATRNELIKEVLRDYRYIEATGLGVPRKIIKGMLEHNGTEPDLVEEADRFTVRLWKRPTGQDGRKGPGGEA